MSSTRSLIVAAKARINRSLSRGGIFGSPKITDLPPPCLQTGGSILKGHGAREAKSFPRC
jgi:hypothetical protein